MPMKININKEKSKKQLSRPWTFGINTCHAKLWLRDDLPRHAKIASEKCGFKYVRFHNILSEDLGVYTENEKGDPIVCFEKFDLIFDKVIACGYLPFFEISFCPPKLSSGDRRICFYKADITVPNSFAKWSYLIEKIAEHVIERYGIGCVEKWYFEVWNEPDIFFDGTIEDYFELYDYTACAIKRVNKNLRVGGPATSKCLWIKEFIEHIEAGSEVTGYKSVPCDFISTHAYPSDLAFLDGDYSDVSLQSSNVMRKLYSRVRELTDNSSLRGKPVIMGEWNSSAGPLAENHDEKNNGAYIVKILDDVKDIIDGSLYWNLSDIYEEPGFHYTPFHGGYGLFNVNDIPKSSFNAFFLLNKLDGSEPEVFWENKKSGIGAIAADKDGVLRILLYYYKEPDEKVSDEKESIEIEITGIKSETAVCRISSVDSEGGSPYELWNSTGRADYVNAEILNHLSAASELHKSSKILHKNAAYYTLTEQLEQGDIKLLEIMY